MKKLIKPSYLILIGLIAVGTMVFQACKKDSKTSNKSGTSTVRVHLTDAPGDYEEVNIDVIGVEINSDISGWVSVSPISAGIYNLLDFANGLDTLLGSAVLPAGKISQMRMILGTRNTVKIDGIVYELKTPSAQQSGLKFNVNESFLAGVTYDIWIDFDAKKSVVETGSGNYILKPTIRAYTNAITGAITGYALPKAAKSNVYAINGTDTFRSFADTFGYFLIRGIPANSYNVLFENTGGYKDTTVTGVSVVAGAVTDMNTIMMRQ